MNKCLVWTSCLVLCLACTPEDKKIPDDILPIDKMKTLVWELTQAGEYAAHQNKKIPPFSL